ncbi:MAG: UDP-N-acetylmuramate--L-alanine ligase [bacterium]|nr:UDP-N-acetylmuramate--L-alanine ligase [bacterium]
MFSSIGKIHFVGIGGSGMSGIAEVLINLGYIVVGSDIKVTGIVKHLQSLGAEIFIGHSEKNVADDVALMVTSTAISMQNPEVRFASLKNIPIIRRSEMLAELMRLKYSILVAGTHGKTTTTSIISWLMHELNMDPTIVIGGCLNGIGSGAKLGKGKFFVAEADESDGSFLKYNPIVAVLTNIDNDHLDYYGDMDQLKQAFQSFIDKVPFYGFNVLCNDDKIVRELAVKTNRKTITYGIDNPSSLMAENIKVEGGFVTFNVKFSGEILGEVQLPIPGRHNILNALAAMAVLLTLNVDFKKITGIIKDFQGVGRRLELKGQKDEVFVVDDYGHHPTEMYMTYQAVKEFWCDYDKYVIFQPHRYSRTKILAKEFADVLSCMDRVLLLPIYAASEENNDNISVDTILKHMSNAENVSCFSDVESLQEYLQANIKGKAVVLTLGAGDVYKVGEAFLDV